MSDVFYQIGSFLGQGLAAIVHGMAWVFGAIFSAMDSFIHGMTQGLGVQTGVLTVAFLLLGLFLMCQAARSLRRRRWVAGLCELGLAVLFLGWLIN